jgi:hypothetical protein
VVIVLLSVLGTAARVWNAKSRRDVDAKRTALPVVSSQGTLAHAGTSTPLCPAPSTVRVMKAGIERNDALCRYWVLDGPQNGVSGDAPCEWFVANAK